MADSITTDQDLLDSGLITHAEYTRLTDASWADGLWTKRHEAAWAAVLRQLKSRQEPIEEDDLTDTSELQPAVLHYVLYLAWSAGNVEAKWRHHHKLYIDELSSVRLTISGEEQSYGWGAGVPMHRV